jgi:hypothetical protein
MCVAFVVYSLTELVRPASILETTALYVRRMPFLESLLYIFPIRAIADLELVIGKCGHSFHMVYFSPLAEKEATDLTYSGLTDICCSTAFSPGSNKSLPRDYVRCVGRVWFASCQYNRYQS